MDTHLDTVVSQVSLQPFRAVGFPCSLVRRLDLNFQPGILLRMN
jgi:hypothetical protein